MFMFYGKEKEEDRIKLYCSFFAMINPDLLEEAVNNCIGKIKFLPAPAEIVNEIQLAVIRRYPQLRIKSWDEVLLEVRHNLINSSPYSSPAWSDSIIKSAVESYGWNNVANSSEEMYSTRIAQLRQVYENCVSRVVNGNVYGMMLNFEDNKRLQKEIASYQLIEGVSNSHE